MRQAMTLRYEPCDLAPPLAVGDAGDSGIQRRRILEGPCTANITFVSGMVILVLYSPKLFIYNVCFVANNQSKCLKLVELLLHLT